MLKLLTPLEAVRTGDLSQFQSTLSTYKDQFTNDGTFTLILRLRHNVIKTGIRSLSIAYSRISLRTIAQKLSLDSEENAEYIVSKAIRDGVIEAKIEHEKGWMESWERGTDRGTGRGGVYETGEPREAFQKRIAFCMELHNESVKVSRMYTRQLFSANESPYQRRCGTHLMRTGKSWQTQRRPGSAKRNWPRRSKKGIWMTMATMQLWVISEAIRL
jgi:hypothetical protein